MAYIFKQQIRSQRSEIKAQHQTFVSRSKSRSRTSSKTRPRSIFQYENKGQGQKHTSKLLIFIFSNFFKERMFLSSSGRFQVSRWESWWRGNNLMVQYLITPESMFFLMVVRSMGRLTTMLYPGASSSLMGRRNREAYLWVHSLGTNKI